jgi:hypothetical protein
MESKWQLILHEQFEDPYFEITNGPISLCCNAGFVGETEEEEDSIFKKVVGALNNSGIDFHSENKLELAQHIDLMKQSHEIDALQSKCDRYEKIVKEHSDLNLALAAMLNGYQNLSMYQKDWFTVQKDLINEYTKMVLEYDAQANEALSAGEGEGN